MKRWISSRSYKRKNEKGSAEFVSKGTFFLIHKIYLLILFPKDQKYIWTSSPNNQEAMFESLGNEGFFSSLKKVFSIRRVKHLLGVKTSD